DENEFLIDSGGLYLEPLHHVLLAFAVNIYGGHDPIRMEFFHQHRTLRFVSIRQVVVRDAVRPVPHEGDNLVLAIEFSEILAAAILVQATSRIVIPEVKLAERGTSRLEKLDFPNRVLCHRVTTTTPTLYFKLGKVEFKYLFPRCARLRKLYEYRLRFPIRIAGNVVDLRILVWRCYVIFLITRNTRHCKSLGEGLAGCTIRVYDVVDHPIVALLPDAGVQDILTHKHLLLDTGNPRLPILADYDNVVQLGAVADVLVATQPPACKA